MKTFLPRCLALALAVALLCAAPWASATPTAAGASAAADGKPEAKKRRKGAKASKGKKAARKGKKAARKGKKARRSKRRKVQHHIVLPGEILGQIATLYGVTSEEIRRWNSLENDFIKAGQKLKVLPRIPVRERRKINYTVREGDNLGKIAKRFGMRIEQIRKINRLKGDAIRAGQDLTLFAAKGSKVAYAVGTPTRGRLVNGERMPPGPGYVVRQPEETYGTSAVIDSMLKVIAKVRRRDKHMPPIVVGDISRKRGGRFKPHFSHQNGLDVDMGYVPKDKRFFGRFFKVRKGNLDVRRTFKLLKAFLDTGKVEYIFVNHSVQRLLYPYARKHMNKAQLERIFQYPRPHWQRVGVIRHVKGHDDHFHVRFRNSGKLAAR